MKKIERTQLDLIIVSEMQFSQWIEKISLKQKSCIKRKDVKGLRKHIYSLDTSPLETVMNLISIQDRPFFDKMYPNTRGGEFLARIAYQHRTPRRKS